MSYDELCGEYFDPRAMATHECPNCGREWQLINRGYDEIWFCFGGGMQSEEEPMIGDKCPACILDEMKGAKLLKYVEETGKRALVLRGLLSTGGAPLDENEPVIAWAWEAFKESDAELLAEAVRDALWYEREEMIEWLRECV